MIFQGHSIGSSHSQLCHLSLDCSQLHIHPSVLVLQSWIWLQAFLPYTNTCSTVSRGHRRDMAGGRRLLILRCLFCILFLAPTVCSASFWTCRLSKGTVPVIPLEPAVPQWLCSLSGYYRGGLLSWNTTYLKFPALYASPPAPPMNTSTPGFTAVLTSLCAPVPSLGLSAHLEGLLPRALSTPQAVILQQKTSLVSVYLT